MKTTLEQWQVLRAIVEEGGFAQAAEKLHRSQSAVSYAVARLQEQLAWPCCARRGGGCG
ncbi:chromosome replication initiation inhibitor protein [Chromobacterium violaceum]|uniref:Chromosome replication initiation inhibitor protein n=1 Tax=Chromobacterium violaceum TaxID=536 RepID=A0A3S4HHS8_CHRVL|nr:chromosome replication initiation inhibitor protein [Chromobacterium violaceum]